MHLESLREQYVRIPAAKLLLHFARGETIHTENSYKFTENTISALMDDAGFRVEQMWRDPLERYALTLASLQ
jgi:L-histidine Nalpha-methyltransferase